MEKRRGADFLKRLIEVALPIKEISAESVRDKSLRHGHISTLHLWWARRPLPASRAIVFASLVPDPDDAECPQAFQDAIHRLLKGDIYKPIPPQEDTLRNRLLSFIARWSKKQLEFEAGKISTPPAPKEMLDENCLVKWESSINPKIIGIARELVQAAYGYMPTVLDPFAGGGAIPLEAVRLGCNVIANDYNPVAHLIERCTFEFPYKYGKPGIPEPLPPVILSEVEGKSGHNVKSESKSNGEQIRFSLGEAEPPKTVPNILAYDVERHALRILERVKKRIGHLYPQGKDGKPVIGYLWARTAPCSNPSCKKEIPLIRSLLVCDKKLKRVALTMNIESRRITFSIAKGKEIHRTEGTMLTRGNVRCPFCEETTPVADLRTAGLNGKLGEQLLCAIVETNDGKDYRPIEKTDIEGFQEAVRISHAVERPNEKHADSNEAGLRCHNYGYKTFGSMYNGRQLVAMQTFVDETKKTLVVLPQNSISEGLTIYLGLWVSRMSMRFTNMGRFDSGGESFQSPFSTQAIPMIWDYAEPNPFSDSTGGAHNQINWIRGVLEREQFQYFENSQSIQCSNGDGANLSVANKAVDVVVTDPPYFDSIAYADLSDFFYIWLKRVLVEMSPTIFTTPLTPKSEEATSLKHRHEGSEEIANQHFENKLADCLAESKRLCKDDGVIAVMFAHQSTLAWTALINAIFKSRLNVIATYPIDTELANRSVALAGSALSSSVTVICRHRVYGAAASYKDVRIEIEKVVKESVEKFWRYGFRGADLIVACYGPAVGVVGKYEYVEKQGEPVPIGELLEEVRKIALSAIAGAFTGDLSSRFYFVVANIYKTSETQWDDMRLVAQIGCGEEDARKFSDEYHFIIREGDKARLALLRDRENDISSPDQVNEKSPLIDQLHCAMVLWKNEKRTELVRFLHSGARMENDILWKLAQSLFEVLPPETEDRKLINALLSEREALRVETKSLRTKEETQIGLGI